MDKVKIGDLDIAFQHKGRGPALLLLHGALSDSRFWRIQIDALSEYNTVVAWDAPGCGKSSDPPETFRLHDYSCCLAEFISRIGLEKPVILGLSFGSGLALDFYWHYPDIPKALILASAYAGWKGSLPPEEVEKKLQTGLQHSRLPSEEVVEAWISTFFDKPVPETIVDEMREMMSGFHPSGMRAMSYAFAEADLRGMLSRISVPVLLLYGEADKRSPLNIARQLHENIPRSHLVIVPGAGHVVNIEEPEIFNQEVRNFLSKV
jgi:pimeloyl-ACP methyl ester carboxylesterase